MKILTLNLHCFEESTISKNQKLIVDTIIKENIDIIFFQEVGQTKNLPILFDDIKDDNYGYKVKSLLEEKGYKYYYHYKIGNQSFENYDEGVAILSKTELINKTYFYASNQTSYLKWYTRIIVSASTNILGKKLTLTSAHLGWSYGTELFENQFDKIIENLNSKDINIIAGDFNVGPDTKEYNHMISRGYHDLFYNGDSKYFNIPTHLDDIDVKVGSSRIDYIMSNIKFDIIDRRVLFKDNRVSDHFGVLINISL